MIIDTVNANGGMDVYTINIDNLTREQAYGLPVNSDNGLIIGFVSDVDEKYIYIHIFNKDILDIEKNPTSVKIVNA